MKLLELFTEHPHAVGETYFEHMKQASRFGMRMLVTAFASFAHAALPFLFKDTGSRAISELYSRLSHRSKVATGCKADNVSLRRVDRRH